MRKPVTLTLATIAAAALLSAGATPAQAKPCGSLTLSGHSWIVGGDGVRCRFMRHWSRSMLRGEGRPPGWQCHKRGRGASRSGGCSKGPNGTTPFFIYYPPD